MKFNRLFLRAFQIFCGFTLLVDLFCVFVLGSATDASTAGVDLVVYTIIAIGLLAIGGFSIVGILWARRALEQNLTFVQTLKILSLRMLLPIGTFVLLWIIWGFVYPISLVRFSSGETHGDSGSTTVYFIDEFTGYRLQFVRYEYTPYDSGNYDESVAESYGKTLQIRHKITGEIYLKTFDLDGTYFYGDNNWEIAQHSSDVDQLEINIQRGRERFELVTKQGKKPWL